MKITNWGGYDLYTKKTRSIYLKEISYQNKIKITKVAKMISEFIPDDEIFDLPEIALKKI